MRDILSHEPRDSCVRDETCVFEVGNCCVYAGLYYTERSYSHSESRKRSPDLVDLALMNAETLVISSFRLST
jgi:hypothetical protein